MLVLNTVARNVLHTEGIALVQSITRPLGIPIQHSSIPFQTSIQGQTSNQNLPFQRDQLANQLKTVDSMNLSIKIAEEQYQLSLEQTKLTQESDAKSKDLLASTEALRDHIADFDDEFRPLRAYFYWEPHCFDIPMCFAIRSLFDSLDGIDATTELTGEVQVNTDRLADIAPKLTALLPQTLASMKTSRDLALSTYNSQKALYDQQEASNDTALAMGQAFDNAKKRRPVLPASGGLHQPRLRTRSEVVHVTGRQVRADVHHPRGRSRDGRGHQIGWTPSARPPRRP